MIAKLSLFCPSVRVIEKCLRLVFIIDFVYYFYEWCAILWVICAGMQVVAYSAVSAVGNACMVWCVDPAPPVNLRKPPEE